MNLKEQLNICGNRLKRWNKDIFGNVQRKIKSLKNEISMLRETDRTEETIRKEEDAAEELDDWLMREELLWKQRARAD